MKDFRSSVVSNPINQASSNSSSLTIKCGNPTSSLIPNSDGPLAIDDYFNSFPVGYRFRPFDSELIVNYLETKIRNELPPPNKIHDVNLYTYNPQTLSEKYTTYGEKEWYFFTPRNRKYLNGKRPNRAAGDGYWKATGADKTIKFNGVTVGFRKVLVFYTGKPPKGDKTSWIMHEYRVSNPPKTERVVGDMKLDDWVLCKIYKKDDKTTGVKRRYQDDEIQNQGQAKRISAVKDSAVEGLPFDQMNSNYNGNIESSAAFGSYDIYRLHHQNRFAKGSQFLSLPSHQQQAMTKIDFNYPSDFKLTQPSELPMETSMMLEEFNQNRHREEPWDLSSQFDIINYDQFLENIESIMPVNSMEPSELINDDDSRNSDIN